MAPVDLVTKTTDDVTSEQLEKFKTALKTFKAPDESDLVTRASVSIRQHPNSDVEGYFEWVTRTGKSALPWAIVRPVFLWKIEFVLDEMMRLERSRLKKDEDDIKLDKDTAFKLQFIKERAAEFEGPPFTFQRICELLITPSRHYKRIDKFIRALDKNVNVVSIVTEAGVRITGSDWPMPDHQVEGKVEKHFFGKVDELDGLPVAGDCPSLQERAPAPFGPVLPGVVTPPTEEEPVQMTRQDSNSDSDSEKTEPMEAEAPPPTTKDANRDPGNSQETDEENRELRSDDKAMES